MKKLNFFASLKSLKKGVGSVSAPTCHGSPTLLRWDKQVLRQLFKKIIMHIFQLKQRFFWIFFYVFFGGLDCRWPLLCLCRAVLYFWEMSGFEPRELPKHAAAPPTLPPISSSVQEIFNFFVLLIRYLGYFVFPVSKYLFFFTVLKRHATPLPPRKWLYLGHGVEGCRELFR